jgi:hypothetical protein
MNEIQRSIEMSDDIVMGDVHAKLAKAREKKAAAKQEKVTDKKRKDTDRKLRWVAGYKSKSYASNRKSYNKKKKSKTPKVLKKAPSNGDDAPLKNCPPPKKQEVCGNADSGDEPPELLVHQGDEVDTDQETNSRSYLYARSMKKKRITTIFVVVAQVLTQMTTLL